MYWKIKTGILKFALFLELQEQTDNNGSQSCNKLSSLVHGAKYQHKHPNLQHSKPNWANIQTFNIQLIPTILTKKTPGGTFHQRITPSQPQSRVTISPALPLVAEQQHWFQFLELGWSTSSHRHMVPSSPAPRIVLDKEDVVTFYQSTMETEKENAQAYDMLLRISQAEQIKKSKC